MKRQLSTAKASSSLRAWGVIKMKKRNTRAQTLLEFTAIIGLVVVALVVMSPLFKRSIQSVIKVTADQLAPQNASEQATDESRGYLVNSFTVSRVSSTKFEREAPSGITEYVTPDETVNTTTSSFTNMGFTNGVAP